MALPGDQPVARHRRIAELLAAAAERGRPERDAFLDAACADDVALRDEVASLLRARDRMKDFLEVPAARQVLLSPPLSPGDSLGPYAITRVVGVGGSSVVYEAMQASPQRRVALKVMRAGVATDEAQRRFREEAEILGRLQHPSIATVFEAGVHRGHAYFALEYVENARTLAEHAGANRLGARRRAALVADVCDAVHHGHQKGVVHCDLKPGNVLVGPAGRPKVIDFGIARVADAGGPGRVGPLAGTPPYMSPEQCDPDAAPPDVRSDVYSLGVLLYELLSGHLPHETAALPVAEAMRVVREELPVPVVRRGRRFRGDIAAILGKALAKDREHRYASADALADDLRRWLAHRPVEARAAGPLYVLSKFARRQRVAFLALVAAAATLVTATLLSVRMAVEKEGQRRAAELEAYVANIAAASAALRVGDVGEARQRLEQAPAALRNWEWRHLESRIDRSVRRIDWHPIRAGAASPDGARLAASAHDGQGALLRLWDGTSGAVLATAETGARAATALALDPGRRVVAAGYPDGRIELRDATTAHLLRTVHGHRETVNSLAFDPGGRRLASAGRDRTIRIWDPASGALLRTLEGHTDRVIDVAFDPTGTRLASGGREGAIRIWDAATGASLADLAGHGGSVEGVAFSPDGTRLASVSRDQTLRIWDAATGASLAVRRGHEGNVRDVAFGPDGRTIATASYDRSLRLWDADGRELAVLRGHTGVLWDVYFQGGAREVVSFSADGTIRFWPAAEDEEIPALAGHADSIAALAFAADGRRLVSASADGTVRVWDVEARRSTILLRAEGRIHAAALAPGDGKLVACSEDATRVCALPGGAVLETWPAALCVAVGPDARTYLAQGARIHVRDLATGASLRSWEAHGGMVLALALDPAGKVLASYGSGGGLRCWATATGELLAERPAGGNQVRSLAFSPDGRILAAGRRDGVVELTAPATLTPIARLEGHLTWVAAVAFSPDGTRLASCAYDGTVRLWDVAARRQVAVLHGHRTTVLSLAFSPDGNLLASGDGAMEVPGLIRLWRAFAR